MVTSQWLYGLFVVLVMVERLFELALSRRNATWARAQGGLEFGAGHFRWMQLLHTVFFAGCLVETYALQRPFMPPLGYSMLGVALAAQALRYWAIKTLGRRWNVRVIVVPGKPAVTTGPYRLVRHPNYLAVVLEGFAIPLIHGAWITATVFSVLNAWLLHERIRCEELALSEHCDYRGRFAPSRRSLQRATAEAQSPSQGQL